MDSKGLISSGMVFMESKRKYSVAKAVSLTQDKGLSSPKGDVSMLGKLLSHCAVSGICGACGGLALFLSGLRSGRTRRERLLRKALLEVVGGFLVASIVAPSVLSPDGSYRRWALIMLLSFAIGACWSVIIQVLRKEITRIVERVLGTTLGEDEKEAK